MSHYATFVEVTMGTLNRDVEGTRILCKQHKACKYLHIPNAS